MRVERIIISILCIILVSSLGVFASDQDTFATGYNLEVDEIFSDEIAVLELTLTNRLPAQQSFQVFSEDPRWIIDVEPNNVVVPGASTGVFRITLDPTTAIDDADNYAVPIVVRSITNRDTDKFSPIITVQSDAYREYAPAVFLGVEVGDDGDVDPREPVVVELRVVNKNPLDYETFALQVQSDLFEETYTTVLAPNDDFVKELSFEVDSMLSPGNRTVTVTMSGNGEVIGSPQTSTYTVLPTFSSFERAQDVSQGFLQKNWNIELTNVANIEKKEQVLIPLSGMEVRFTSVSHPYEIEVVDGQEFLAFDIVLEPGQTTTLDVSMNMRPFFYTILILVVAIAVSIILYYILRSPVVVSRKTQIIGDKQSTSKMKVLVNVRNRTGKVLEGVKIFERLPHIAEVEESFEVGTVKPSKVLKNQKKGTLVRWDFVTLEPYEERIITYRISSKLSILGDLTLPATTVQFSTDGKNVRKVSFDSKN